MTAILALDQGTTGSTALLVDESGEVLGRGYREFPQYYPGDGWVEHDPLQILDASVAAMREAVTTGAVRPRALGITNQRETVVLWERASGTPVARAIVWQDRRTEARCAALKAEGREAWLRERTGLLADPYFSATKIEWLLRDEAIGRRARRGELAVGTIDSWLLWRLGGGVHLTDHTNASRTLLYDLRSREWSDELLSVFGVPRALLPQLVPSSGVIAELSADVLGYPIPIAGVAGDQQAALFGQGCFTPGTGKVTYGTGAFLLVHAGAMLPTPPAGVLATIALSGSGSPEYALEGSVFVAGAAVQWLRDGLGVITHASETAALAAGIPDNGGVVFVPAFVGLGTPYWAPLARGTIVGLTRATTHAHLARAALESIAHSTTDLLDAMELSVERVAALRVDGGAAENEWLLQFQADVLGRPVERPQVLDTTAMGAAGLAGMGMGVWSTAEQFVGSRSTTVFAPRLSSADRSARRQEWSRAVRAALGWAGDGRERSSAPS